VQIAEQEIVHCCEVKEERYCCITVIRCCRCTAQSKV